MASLSSKVKTYCANNGVANVDFMVDVLLQDDSNGQGPYIKTWNVSGVTQPTDEQLNAVDSAADLEERQNAVRSTRRRCVSVPPDIIFNPPETRVSLNTCAFFNTCLI